MSETIVELKSVSKTYGKDEVLKGVDLKIQTGERIGIMGPNGGGKSTLLMLIAGLVRPTSGNATVFGMPAHEVPLKRASHVGLVLAQPGLYPLLTGRENLHNFGALFSLSPEEVDQRIQKPMADLGLAADTLDQLTRGMSTGMQQKLAFTRAMMLRPRLLLLDEPAANLDPPAAVEAYAMACANAEMTTILVSHDLGALQEKCGRTLLVMNTGIEEVEMGGQAIPDPGPLLKAWTARETRCSG